MKNIERLSQIDFLEVIKKTSLFAFDLIIKNKHGEVLLGLRNNSPAKGFWFVPGGRLYRNEPLDAGLKRILHSEIGCKFNNFSTISFCGLYDHIYDENFLNKSCGTHYVVCALEMIISNSDLIIPDDQNLLLKFMSIPELLDSDKVHNYTKQYFIESPNNKFLGIV